MNEAAGERYLWSDTASGAAESADATLPEGALDTCASLENFRAELAAPSFADACTDAADCAFEFVPDPSVDTEADDGVTISGFRLDVPPLRAPVGLRRELRLVGADGGVVSSATYDFCLISINEAPEAVDDEYVVIGGATLRVEGGGPDSLLANDVDDVDAANLPLAVDAAPVRAPNSAIEFELGTDGGFVYAARAEGILNFVSDSFEYRVSDGENTATATVRIRIEASNRAPVLDGTPPPLTVEVGEFLEEDLAVYFADPDGDPLAFSADGDDLPPSGAITLSSEGLLQGTPIDEDVGDYELRIVASDGERETDAVVSLSVIEPPNRAPRYVGGEIDDIVISRFSSVELTVTGLFVDPDDDPLVYDLDGVLPRVLTFDGDSGILSGFALQRGEFEDLIIRATDPDGESVESEPFAIVVE